MPQTNERNGINEDSKEQFEITTEADPFHNESNIKYLENVISNIEKGNAKLIEHDIIEE